MRYEISLSFGLAQSARSASMCWGRVSTRTDDRKGRRTLKLKEPVLQTGSFNFQGGEEKSPNEVNCIMCLHNMLDATPTSLKRLHSAFYEPSLRSSRLGGVLTTKSGTLHQWSRIHPTNFLPIRPGAFQCEKTYCTSL